MVDPVPVTVDDEEPSPAPDGRAVDFRARQAYLAGSLCVRVDLIPLPLEEVHELDPLAGRFRLGLPPRADQLVRIDYDRG